MQEKEFLRYFKSKVKGTISQYKLLDKSDKVLVACSGGKDSTTVLYLLNKFGYDVEGMIIDLLMGDWSEKNLENVKAFCKQRKIKLHIVSMRGEFGCSICYIKSIIKSKENLTSCTICGILKRWLLNKKAREFGATKLATGHNLDDEAQTALLNLLNGNAKLGMNLGPRTGVIEDTKFVPRVKPLYFCPEAEIRRYSELMGFPVLYEKCPCSVGSFRAGIREFLNRTEQTEPGIKHSIVNNALLIFSELRKQHPPQKRLIYCEICQEPARNRVCKACTLVGKLS